MYYSNCSCQETNLSPRGNSDSCSLPSKPKRFGQNVNGKTSLAQPTGEFWKYNLWKTLIGSPKFAMKISKFVSVDNYVLLGIMISSN